jgi:hypothetical protein
MDGLGGDPHATLDRAQCTHKDEKNVVDAQSAFGSLQSPHIGHCADSRMMTRIGRSTPRDAHVEHTTELESN